MLELLRTLSSELKEINYRLFSVFLYLAFLFFITPIYIKFHSEADTAYRLGFLLFLFILMIRLIPSLIKRIRYSVLKAEDVFITAVLIAAVIGSFLSERVLNHHISDFGDIIYNNYSATFFWNYIISPQNKIIYVAVLRLSYICISSKLLYAFLQTPETSGDFFDDIHSEKIVLEVLYLILFTVVFSLMASSRFLDKMFPL